LGGALIFQKIYYDISSICGKEGVNGIIIFSVIAITSLIIAILATFFAAKERYQLYFVSVLGILIFTYLYGFTVGQMAVCLSFIPITIAIQYSVRLVRNRG